MSELLALGVSHKTAPLEVRERLSLTEGSAVGALRELTSSPVVHEAAAISTCNRTELYLVVADSVEAESTALGVLTRQADIPPTELLGHLYSRRGTEAADHRERRCQPEEERDAGEGAGRDHPTAIFAAEALREAPERERAEHQIAISEEQV